MKYKRFAIALGVLLWAGFATVGCEKQPASTKDDQTQKSLSDEQKQAVVDNYATVAYATYQRTLTDAKALQSALETLVESPSASNLETARKAWLTSRKPYGQSEVLRFYGGPIDDAKTGVEGQLNAWPLDEAYIDYVTGKPDAGLINEADVELTSEKLVELNEKNGEKNISTGYHAIEFLLWGQDQSDDGPGGRPHTDFVDGEQGTAKNQARRARYVALSAQQIVDDLSHVTEQWKPDAKNYRAEFVSMQPDLALQRMLTGMGMLSGAELSGERMEVALETADQEDEQSCFSDNTHSDIIANATAVQNVYLGRFGDQDGPGIDVLVAELDPALDIKLKEQLQASIDAAEAIPAPFDRALQSEQGRAKIRATIDALRTQTQTIVEVADLLGIRLNLA